MINPSLDPAKLHEEYALAKPFPHIVLDSFAIGADEVAETLAETDISEWSYDPNVAAFQVNKYWNSDLNSQMTLLKCFGSLTRSPRLISSLNSRASLT